MTDLCSPKVAATFIPGPVPTDTPDGKGEET